VDALSRHHLLLNTLGAQILGFDDIKELYEHDDHFAPIFASCLKKHFDGFYLSNGYLFFKSKLCILNYPLDNFLFVEVTSCLWKS